MSFSRREFLSTAVKTAGALTTLSSIPFIASCTKNKSATVKNEYALLRVSSDIYKSDDKQRLAFAIFDSNRKSVEDVNAIDVTLISPDNKSTNFKDVKLRNKGIKDKGIFSFYPKLNIAGNWSLNAKYKDQDLDLTFEVPEKNVAPIVGDLSPITDTPTDTNPLDAKILCTRSQGNCGLHKNNLRNDLKAKKPLIILFATPARCQTAYCGPVLELTKKVSQNNSIDVIHNEIYKDATSNDVIDSVAFWDLPSEPWLFGIDSNGKIIARLDGAFDQSEIEEVFALLT